MTGEELVALLKKASKIIENQNKELEEKQRKKMKERIGVNKK